MSQPRSPFDFLIHTLSQSDRQLGRKVDQEEYREFERVWVIYALQDKRYGQAFCEHFGIPTATPLYYFNDEKISRRWILDNYLK